MGAAPQPPPLALLAHVVDLLGAAKGLFSWLNRSGGEARAPMGAGCPLLLGLSPLPPAPRYLFSTLNDFSASRDIVLLCAQLAETLQEVGAPGGGHAAPRPR